MFLSAIEAKGINETVVTHINEIVIPVQKAVKSRGDCIPLRKSIQ